MPDKENASPDAYPEYQLVFTSSIHLDLFEVKESGLSERWTRVWTQDGRCFTYDPASLAYSKIKYV